MTIDGPTPIAPDVLIKAGEFKPGELADMSKVNEGVERVRRAIRREGYMEVRVSTDRKLDDEKKTVNVVIHVLARPAIHDGQTQIVTGLDLNSESEIRRIWVLKPGKPFNPEYPDLFLRRIKEQGTVRQSRTDEGGVSVESERPHGGRDIGLRRRRGPGPGRGGGRAGRGRGGYERTPLAVLKLPQNLL